MVPFPKSSRAESFRLFADVQQRFSESLSSTCYAVTFIMLMRQKVDSMEMKLVPSNGSIDDLLIWEAALN